ncbi:uncharacterized protein VTP21DRAFT_461 [Calcarisporiella thermophila]|uniref:uncharacterized protein n=1 Tax=Calcarisporiella thermophila TaxID=911321 RepID=UPI003742FE40
MVLKHSKVNGGRGGGPQKGRGSKSGRGRGANSMGESSHRSRYDRESSLGVAEDHHPSGVSGRGRGRRNHTLVNSGYVPVAAPPPANNFFAFDYSQIDKTPNDSDELTNENVSRSSTPKSAKRPQQLDSTKKKLESARKKGKNPGRSTPIRGVTFVKSSDLDESKDKRENSETGDTSVDSHGDGNMISIEEHLKDPQPSTSKSKKSSRALSQSDIDTWTSQESEVSDDEALDDYSSNLMSQGIDLTTLSMAALSISEKNYKIFSDDEEERTEKSTIIPSTSILDTTDATFEGDLYRLSVENALDHQLINSDSEQDSRYEDGEESEYGEESEEVVESEEIEETQGAESMSDNEGEMDLPSVAYSDYDDEEYLESISTLSKSARTSGKSKGKAPDYMAEERKFRSILTGSFGSPINFPRGKGSYSGVEGVWERESTKNIPVDMDILVLRQIFERSAHKKPKSQKKAKNRKADLLDISIMNKRIRKFILEDHFLQELPTEPMDKLDRRIVKLLARKYGLKSKKAGKGNAILLLVKTQRTSIPSDPRQIDRYVKEVRRLKKALGDEVLIETLREAQASTPVKSKRPKSLKSKFKELKSPKTPKTPKPRQSRKVGEEAGPIAEHNVGHRLLSKMGWSPGQTLGITGGITDPVEAVIKNDRRGLGA